MTSTYNTARPDELVAMLSRMEDVTGQRGRATYAKNGYAEFELRRGYELGGVVTLRGERYYTLLEVLSNQIQPRHRRVKQALTAKRITNTTAFGVDSFELATYARLTDWDYGGNIYFTG